MIHWNTYSEFERWNVFTALPELMSWDERFHDTLSRLENGRMYRNDKYSFKFPPTLLAYYNTLPTFARENWIIKDLYFALEHR